MMIRSTSILLCLLAGCATTTESRLSCRDMVNLLTSGPHRTLVPRFQATNKYGDGNCHGEVVLSLDQGLFMFVVTGFESPERARVSFLEGSEPVARKTGKVMDPSVGEYYTGWPPGFSLPSHKDTGCRLAFLEGPYQFALLRLGKDYANKPCRFRDMPADVQSSLRILLNRSGRDI